MPLFLLRNVCFFCDTNGIGALKTCFEKATPETLPFNFAHLLITLIANVSFSAKAKLKKMIRSK